MSKKFFASAVAMTALLLVGCGSPTSTSKTPPPSSQTKPSQPDQTGPSQSQQTTPSQTEQTTPSQTPQTTPKPAEQSQNLITYIQVVKKVYSTPSPPAGAKLDLAYPEVTGLPNTEVQQQINEFLKSKIIPNKFDSQTDFSTSFQVKYEKNDILNIMFTGYEYPHGAAHGLPLQDSYVINLENGNSYSLSDLFKPGSDYLTKLTEIVKQDDLMKRLQTYGNYPGVKSTDSFYLDEGGIYIYYEPYEYTPYAAGYPAFRVSDRDVANWINQDGELWKALGSPDLSEPTNADIQYTDSIRNTAFILSKRFQTQGQDLSPSAATEDNNGNALYAYVTNSASGTGNQVFFFLGDKFLGTDTAKPYQAYIGEAKSTRKGTITVIYHTYTNNQDNNFSVTYTWDGQKLTPDQNFSKLATS